MVGAVSAVNGNYGAYIYGRYAGVSSVGASGRVTGAQGVAALAARRAAQPEMPVEPVRPVTPVRPGASGDLNLGALLQRQASDPSEMAVRMRMRSPEQQEQDLELPGSDGKPVGAQAVQEAAEEGQCQTCEKRKYQDGSDDPGVSFKTPTRLTPGQAAGAVRGHEQEHVVREQAKAARENRRVVSQSVTLHTDICPECGRVYVSGGVTRTVTAAKRDVPAAAESGKNTGFAGFEGVA